MKKLVIASIVLASAATAFAGDVTVSAIRDYNVGKNGVAVGTSVAGLQLTASHVEDAYNRYAVAKSFDVTKVGPVALSASAGVAFQDTVKGENGYGLVLGAKATMPVAKNVDVVAGLDRFIGQHRVAESNGNVFSAGLNVKF